MNKPEVTESGLPIPGLLPQAIAFVRDFAAFAGIRGVVAAFVAEFQDSLDGLKREHSVRRIVTALPLRS